MMNPRNEEKVKEQVQNLAVYFRKTYKLDGQKWELLNSIYFCGTIFTTIGNLHMSVK